ncbi:hypothetical protein HU200_022535 [Digitaria exilis]|uniref:Cytochrome P450 n=1 Tax=Digitaria exilis TaxID=1010633 RepID=A0A835C4X6_9POAL|nr:hypothetical protein HU200_022535 [Digitaria exilis]
MSSPVLFPWLLACLLVSLLAVVYLLHHDRRRRHDLPPGPRPLPIIGSLHLLGTQPHRSLARLAKTHGPLISLRLGTVTTVVASSPSAAREILQRHDAVFSNRSVPDAPGDHSRNSSCREFQEVVTDIMEAVGSPNVSDYFPAVAAADLQGWRRHLARLFARLHRIFDEEIDARLRGRVEWAMTELLQSPTSMAKACDELATVIGSGKSIEESDIGQLPYLQAVVKVWAMGRDKDTWLEPEKFMPERFLGKTVDLRGGDFDLIPFGGGRRICPGMPLAIRMVHLLLASLLNHFTWKLPAEVERNGVDMAEKFGLTLTKAVPLCAIATPI